RTMIQRTFERTRRIELKLGVEPSHYEPGAPREKQREQPAPQARDSGSTEERDSISVGGRS
ncbi:MAG: glycosyltransferase family 2 protein, partial [Dehalococcoidia bacterium]